MQLEWSDLATILILVGLEGILSGDNALVLAVLVLRLPEDQQRKALRYGILGAYILRCIATLLAVYLAQLWWVSLIGGLYLLWLPYKHFTQHPDESDDADKAPVRGWFGLSAFWSTVISVELTDLIFAVDSILVAVALTKKTPVIIAGGILGITMMRLLTLQVLALVKRYPKLIDGAYLVVAWVGIKLLWEFLHKTPVFGFHLPAMPREIGLGVVVVLFVGAFLYARAHERKEDELVESCTEAEALFASVDRPDPSNDDRSGERKAPPSSPVL